MPRAQHHGKSEIRIAGRIRGAELDPGGGLLPGLVHGTRIMAERFLRAHET